MAEYSRIPQSMADVSENSGSSSEEDDVETQEETIQETANTSDTHNNTNGVAKTIGSSNPEATAKKVFEFKRRIRRLHSLDGHISQSMDGTTLIDPFDTYTVMTSKNTNTIKTPFATREYKGVTCRRWLCIVLSAMIGLSIVGVFLYGLPCQLLDGLWQNLHFGMPVWTQKLNIGLYGDVHLWASEDEIPHIIVAYRTLSSRSPSCKWGWMSEEPYSGGVIAVKSSNGLELWKRPLFGIPTSIDCEHLDINEDGFADCIIAGSHGLLAAMDAKSGEMIWYLHEHGVVDNGIQPVDITTPWFIPDIDNDHFPDILVVACIGKLSNYHNRLLLVSGHSGKVIGQPVQGGVNCTLGLSHLEVIDTDEEEIRTTKVKYLCHKNDGTILPRKVTLEELYNNAVLKWANVSFVVPTAETYFPPIPVLMADGTYFTGTPAIALLIKKESNEELCPDKCSLITQLRYQPPNDHPTVWYLQRSHATGMYPCSALLSNVSGSTQVHELVDIFFLKTWEWGSKHHGIKPKRFYFSRTEFQLAFEEKDEIEEQNDLIRLARQGRLAHPEQIETSEFTSMKQPMTCDNSEFHTEEVWERITVVAFVKGLMYYDNFTLVPAVQICKGQECQPHPNMMRGSIDVMDIYGDGYVSMIDYTTSYEFNYKTNQYDLVTILSKRSVLKQAEIILALS